MRGAGHLLFAIALVSTTPLANAQVQEPPTVRRTVRNPVTPGRGEPPCPTPTLEQCQDEAWLATECGVLEQNREGICAQLFYAAMLEEEATYGSQISIVAQEINNSGIDFVVQSTVAPSSYGNEYVPDLYSLTSQKVAAQYTGTDMIGINLYAQWNGNGTQVTSCQELAFESYFDITEFERKVAHKRDNYRFVLDTAFGPANDPASIGTRHLANPFLRGKDGTSFGVLYNAGQTRPKNAFYAIPNHPRPPGADPVPGAPSLWQSIAKHSLAGKIALTLMTQAVQKTYPNTWAQQRLLSETLAYEHGVPPSPTPLQITLATESPDPNAYLVTLLGSTNDPVQPTRKYLDAELDELHRLQRRMQRVLLDWHRADVRFAGSNWNPDKLGGGGGGINGIVLAPPPAPPQNPWAIKAQIPFTPKVNIDQIAAPDLETPVRRRILDDLQAIFDQAAKAGCFKPGVTPCDFSPMAFASEVRDSWTQDQDAVLEQCQKFSGGSFTKLFNLNVVFVDDPNPNFAQYNCKIVTGPTLTAQQYRNLAAAVPACREKQIAYAEAKAKAAALERVKSIPELVDPATGNVIWPGIRKSRDEYMGNKYFGLGYDYDFGFETNAQSEICSLQIWAGGHMRAYAKVFGKERNLLHAEAIVDTEAHDVHAFTRVAGINVFTPVNVNWPDPEPLTWSFTKSVSTGKKDVPLVNTTIVVVVVPLKVTAGISGEAGVRFGLELQAQPFDNKQCPWAKLSGIAEPYLRIDGFLSAAIDIFVAKAGIRGNINIIAASLPFKPGLELQLLGGQQPGLPAGIALNVNLDLRLQLSTLSGSVEAFAQAGWCPFCVKGSFSIVKWKGPEWNTKLLDQTYAVNLGDLNVALFGN